MATFDPAFDKMIRNEGVRLIDWLGMRLLRRKETR